MDSVVRRQAEPAPGWTVPELEENRNTAAHLRPAHRVLHDVRDRGPCIARSYHGSVSDSVEVDLHHEGACNEPERDGRSRRSAEPDAGRGVPG
jgi:hypothetical protein